MKPDLKTTVATSALLIAAASEGAAAEWIQLLPLGEVKGRDGRSWKLGDRAAAEKIVAASLARAGSGDLVIDYDHQSDFASVPGVGGRAPAAGWIKELQARDDGIWARPQWTAAAAAALEAYEYRYISPVFAHSKAGAIQALLRAGLTNTPNLDLAAVASEQHDGDHMDLSKIAQALGLGATATEEDILAAIANWGAAKTAANSELGKVRTALKLAETADGDAIVVAINAQAATASGGDAAVIALQTELNVIKGERAAEKAEEAVNAAVAAGKINPAARATFIALATSDRAQFDAIVGALPVIIDPLAINRGKVDPDSIVLTDEDIATCTTMGLDQADFLKTKKEMAL